MNREWGGPEGFTKKYIEYIGDIRIVWGEDCEGMRENASGELPQGVQIIQNDRLITDTELIP